MKLFHLLDCKYPKGFLSSTKHLLPSLVMAVGVLGWMSTVFGYEVAEVSNGGTIKGRVTLSGKPPDPKAFNLVTYPDPEYCGKISNGHGWRLLRDFVVAEDGALQGVVVFLEDVKVGKHSHYPFQESKPGIVSFFPLPLSSEVDMVSKW